MATLFAYVDESGQDVKALFFVVSVLVVSSERDALTKELEQIEQESKKDNRKWHRADYRYRRDYIERVSNLDKLKNKIFFKKFPKLKKYMEFTATATADALRQRRPDRVVVYVDGLPKGQIPAFKRQLKPSLKKPTKVQGVRKEENNTFIRLLYSIFRLVRDASEDNEWAKDMVRRLKRRGLITEL